MTDFSERFGFREPRTILQLSDMDQRLRNRIWSEICYVTFDKFASITTSTEYSRAVSRSMQSDFFGLPSDEIQGPSSYFRKHIKNEYMALPWNRVYDFVEFLCASNIAETWHQNNKQSTISPAHLLSRVTPILEQEKSGYRFLDEKLIKISDEVELDGITQASASGGSFESVGEHIRTAADHYSNREKPDYRNSIKESISAVEAAAKVLTGDPKATLGAALKQLGESGDLHSALKKGFSNLYGWTSDEGGIRHALMDKTNLSEEDARYMLVSCSAFANYLMSKARK